MALPPLVILEQEVEGAHSHAMVDLSFSVSVLVVPILSNQQYLHEHAAMGVQLPLVLSYKIQVDFFIILYMLGPSIAIVFYSHDGKSARLISLAYYNLILSNSLFQRPQTLHFLSSQV